jgi:hypothetical protein
VHYISTTPRGVVLADLSGRDRKVSVGVNVHGVVGITRRAQVLCRMYERTKRGNEHTLVPVRTIFPETKMRSTTNWA